MGNAVPIILSLGIRGWRFKHRTPVLIALSVFLFIGVLVSQYENHCEDATFNRGEIVIHRLTGERAIIASSFCSGHGSREKRMYAVTNGAVDGLAYWGQFEIK